MFSRSVAPVLGALAGLTFGEVPASYGQPSDSGIPQATMPAVGKDVAVSTTLEELGRAWQPEQQLYQIGITLPRQEQLDVSLILEGHKNWYVFAAKTEAPVATAEETRAFNPSEKRVLEALRDQVFSSPYYYRIAHPTTHEPSAVSVVLFFDQNDKFYGLTYVPNVVQKAAGAAIYQSLGHDSVGLSISDISNSMADSGRGAGLKVLIDKVEEKVSSYEAKFQEQVGVSDGYMFSDSRSDEVQAQNIKGAVLKYGGIALGALFVVVVAGAVLKRREEN